MTLEQQIHKAILDAAIAHHSEIIRELDKANVIISELRASNDTLRGIVKEYQGQKEFACRENVALRDRIAELTQFRTPAGLELLIRDMRPHMVKPEAYQTDKHQMTYRSLLAVVDKFLATLSKERAAKDA